MTFKTPLAIAAAVVTGLAGVATAAIALPSPPSSQVAATVAAPSATPEVRTETVHRMIHVTRRDRGHHDHGSATAATTSTRTGDSRHRAGFDDSGHHGRGHDDSGHHGGGRGRGGHDD